jgi:hypothetical protein
MMRLLLILFVETFEIDRFSFLNNTKPKQELQKSILLNLELYKNLDFSMDYCAISVLVIATPLKLFAVHCISLALA